jgi:hypothetical protein
MKIELRRPRSCSGCFVWLLVALFTFVLINNCYAVVRIASANVRARSLAGQLGYSPSGFLRSDVSAANANIVTGSLECSADFYFVTPLDLPDFEARLMAMLPGSLPFSPVIDYSRALYSDLPLDVNGTSEKQPEAKARFPAIPTQAWFLPLEPSIEGGHVNFYQTSNVSPALTFRGQQIDSNIALIHWSAGRYPIWVPCYLF